MNPTQKRLSKIRSRLREEYTVDHLKEAVDGCLSNQRNVKRGYTEIELICRDQSHVEQYRAWKQNGPPGKPVEKDPGPSEREDWEGLLKMTEAERD